MTDTMYRFRNISLKDKTYSKLDNLSNTIVPGVKLSKQSTIEILLNSISSPSKGKKQNGFTNEPKPEQSKA